MSHLSAHVALALGLLGADGGLRVGRDAGAELALGLALALALAFAASLETGPDVADRLQGLGGVGDLSAGSLEIGSDRGVQVLLHAVAASLQVAGKAVEFVLQNVLKVGDVHLGSFFFFFLPFRPVFVSFGMLFSSLVLRLRGLRWSYWDGRRNECLAWPVAVRRGRG